MKILRHFSCQKIISNYVPEHMSTLAGGAVPQRQMGSMKEYSEPKCSL